METVEVGIVVAGGAILTADDGGIRCARLLLAAGPWARALAVQVGVDLPLTVERHAVATFGWSGGERMPFVVIDTPNGYYLKPEGEQLFIVGGLHAEPPVDPDGWQRPPAAAAGRALRRQARLAAGHRRSPTASPWTPARAATASSWPGLGRHIADLVEGAPAEPGVRILG